MAAINILDMAKYLYIFSIYPVLNFKYFKRYSCKYW